MPAGRSSSCASADNTGVPTNRSAPAVVLAVFAVAAAGILATTAAAKSAPTVRWELLEARPHDPSAWTQGLVAHGGVLIESTGNCCPAWSGRSSLRRVDPRTGGVLARRRIPNPIYTEGVTVLGGSIWQLTWTDGRVFRASASTLQGAGSVAYARDGWGLTRQGSQLVASDGSSRLYWLSVPSLRTTRTVTVRDAGGPVASLNELEMLDGVIWANLWQQDRIALIDPGSGTVRGWLDMSSLRTRIGSGEVLNGIARDPETGHVIVTGKLWDRMFVIRLAEPVPPATR
ncbi:MAG: glutaminyl-peptide cyclotransferase [Actinobacteria bacterium]|nr:glutaminyl-peptide cyclotransferase [Actinomycetota bacterium]